MTTPDQLLYWEDFIVGSSVDFGRTRVTESDIVAFASEFDPQPLHLGETPAGSPSASDWHSCAMLMRMMCDDFLCRAAGAGAPGVEHVKWFGSVLAGDVLRVRRTPLETRASRSRPRVGIVRMLLEVFNHRDEKVMSWLPVQLYDRRDPSAEPPPSAAISQFDDAETALRAPPALPQESADATIGTFDDISIGEETELGSHNFTKEEMLGFATRFNPQYFHADEETAAKSLYGGLIASGWHTASVWNRLFVTNRHEFGRAAQTGSGHRREPLFGPSIAVTDMKWPNPVRPGDTISFRTRIVGKSTQADIADWGVVTSFNEGFNQRGEAVLSLTHQAWVASCK